VHCGWADWVIGDDVEICRKCFLQGLKPKILVARTWGLKSPPPKEFKTGKQATGPQGRMESTCFQGAFSNMFLLNERVP
jgi:hypothetical protein